MLYYSTVKSESLHVLKQLMQLSELNNFYLAGGTALSLYYGHRLSYDLDLFSTSSFANEDIIPVLEKNIQGFNYRNASSPVGLFCFADQVKVDFIKHHHHPMIDPPVLIDGIRMLSAREIMAMKIAAILKRGVKKDFWDIYELLHHFSMDECIKAYTQKYPSQQLVISIPYALTYFTDAEESETPVSLNNQTWRGVKKFIQQKVNEYLR